MEKMCYSGECYQDLVIFQGIPYQGVRHVLERCEVRQLTAGEVVLHPNWKTNEFYHVLNGHLTVHLSDMSSNPIATIQVGQCVGELSVINEELTTAFVKAAGTCSILAMDREALWDLIAINGVIAINLLRLLAHRMRSNTIALIESQLTQAVPDIIYRLDQNGLFLFLNDSIKKLGYRPDELLSKHFEQLLHDEDLAKVSYVRVVEQIRSSNKTPNLPPRLFDERRALDRKTTGLEVRLKRKAGAALSTESPELLGEIFVEVSCTGLREAVVQNHCDPYIGTIGIIRDITERKHLQAQVEEQKARMEAIFNTAVDAIIVINDQGIIESLNQAACEMFDYAESEMLGHNVTMLMDNPHRQHHSDHLASYLVSKRSTPLTAQREKVGLRRDGSLFPMDLSLSVVKLPDRLLFTGIIRDITQRKEAERIIHFQANYDALTKLPNRALFIRTLEQKVVDAKNLGESFALIFIDLDRFKWINDNLGHPAGDALLQESANRLRRTVGEENMVARLGGDEFTTILTGEMEQKAIASVAHKILEQLNRPFLLNGQEVYISGSLGISRFPSDAQDSANLLKKADEAMYASKNAGKNAYHFVSGEHLVMEKKYATSLHR